MAIALRSDSDGITHQIWGQQQEASCAIASIWMARNIAKRMSVDEGEWSLAWRTFQHVVEGRPWFATSAPPGGMSLSPMANAVNHNSCIIDQSSFGNMFANAGTSMAQVAQVLRSEGLNVLHSPRGQNAQPFNTGFLGEASPAIGLLGWYSQNAAGQNQRNGGHFVVAARQAKNGTIVFLDPLWGGQLWQVPNNGTFPMGGLFEEILYLSE